MIKKLFLNWDWKETFSNLKKKHETSKIRKKQECLLSLPLFNTVLECLARATRHEQNNRHADCSSSSKTLPTYRWHDYTDNHIHMKYQIPKCYRKAKEFSKVSGYKIIIQKSTIFLSTHNKQSNIKLINYIYNSTNKKKILSSKFNNKRSAKLTP